MTYNSLHKAILFVCLIIFYGCGYNKTSYPVSLTKAIDVFYTENQNKQVLAYIEKTLATQPSNKIKQFCMLLKAGALCELNKVDSADLLLRNVTVNAQDEQLLFWYNSMKGLILFRQNEFTKAYKILLQTITSKFKDTRSLALNERLLARICFTLNDYNYGYQWLKLSSKHFSETNHFKSVGVNYKILGRHFMNQRNYTDAIYYFKLAETTFKKYYDKEELLYVYINFIDFYQNTSKLSIARHYAILSLNESKVIEDYRIKALIFNNLGEIEMKLKNDKEAIKYFNKTLALSNEHHFDIHHIINAHIKLSKIYRTLRNINESLFHVNTAYSLLPREGFDLVKYEVFFELSETHKLAKQNNKAMLFLDSARITLDSVNQALKKTNEEFYTTKVELAITSDKLKNIQENQYGKLDVLIIIIALVALVLILTVTLFQLRFSKKKVSPELEQNSIPLNESDSNNDLPEPTTRMKGVRKSPNDEKLDELYKKLLIWLETDKKFTVNNLSLEILSKELKTNREYLSRAINKNNTRFIDLINNYRISEAIEILSDTSNNSRNHKLSIIAQKVGFNSDSAFIDAFHKQTGMNPAEFRKNLTNNK